MNVKELANAGTQEVNANELAYIKRSLGFTEGSGARQIPIYSVQEPIYIQVQALSSKDWRSTYDLDQKFGLNLQGDIKVVIAKGLLSGIVRPKQIGGDIIIRFGNEPWLVVKIQEAWHEWTKAIIIHQVE